MSSDPIRVVLLAKLGDRGRPCVARSRRRHPQLHDLAAREQRQVVRIVAQIGPAKATIDDVELAAIETLTAGGAAHRFRGLIDEQRLVPGDQVRARELIAQMAIELTQRNLQSARFRCDRQGTSR